MNKLIAACVGAAMATAASTAQAAFYLIDLTSNGPNPQASATSMDFQITPGGMQQLHATPLPPTELSIPSLLAQNAGGLGVQTSIDLTGQIDDYTVREGIRFTLTPGTVVQFILAGIEFTNVDSNDEYRLVVDGSTSIGGADIPCGGTNQPSSCWVRFQNIAGVGGGADGNDNVAGNPDVVGAQFDVFSRGSFLCPVCLGNDDWRISRLVWEIEALQTVPEPAGLALLGLATFGLARRRRG